MQKGFWIALTCALGVYSGATAQQSENKNYLLSSLTSQIGGSTLELNDGYLSDLPYMGYGMNVNTTVRRFMSLENTRISVRNDFDLYVGAAMNMPQTASIAYFGGNVGLGMQAHFKPMKNLQVLVGGELDAELGIKSYSRDVNNAGNLDLAGNLNLAVTFRYDLPIWKNHLRLQADFRSPLLGIMFVPVRGESYSEIYYFQNYENLFHFSSLHNKYGLNARYLVQIPLKRSYLNIGLHSENLKYAANNMVFKRSITSLEIGATCDLVMFGGSKNHAPARFISSEW